jgi:hypothetical protein
MRCWQQTFFTAAKPRNVGTFISIPFLYFGACSSHKNSPKFYHFLYWCILSALLLQRWTIHFTCRCSTVCSQQEYCNVSHFIWTHLYKKGSEESQYFNSYLIDIVLYPAAERLHCGTRYSRNKYIKTPLYATISVWPLFRHVLSLLYVSAHMGHLQVSRV